MVLLQETCRWPSGISAVHMDKQLFTTLRLLSILKAAAMQGTQVFHPDFTGGGGSEYKSPETAGTVLLVRYGYWVHVPNWNICGAS